MNPVQLSRNMKSQRKPAHPTAAPVPLKPQQLTSLLQALHAMSAATAQYKDCHTDPVTHDPAEPLHLYYIFNTARPSTTTAALTMLESRLSTAPAALTLQIVVIYMHTMHAWLTVQMLWQMHGRTLQAVHMLIVCMGIFSDILK